MLKGSPSQSLSHLVRGAQLLLRAEFRPFILVPLAINVVLFIVLTGFLIAYFSSGLDWMMGFLPDWSWVQWLVNALLWLIWPIFATLILVIYGYTFNLITNLIAAPFYGLLAEKIENHLIDGEIDSEPIAEMIPRTIFRELKKLWYFLTRALLLALLSLVLMFVPLVNLVVPAIWILWSAWSMAIQYSDYPADNHKTPFKTLRGWLGSEKLSSYTFGGLVMLAGMIPVINIFAMPIAVAGATVAWVERGKQKCLVNND